MIQMAVALLKMVVTPLTVRNDYVRYLYIYYKNPLKRFPRNS